MIQNVSLWLKSSSPGNALEEEVTVKDWSSQAAMQVFLSPSSSISRYFPKMKQNTKNENYYNLYPNNQILVESNSEKLHGKFRLIRPGIQDNIHTCYNPPGLQPPPDS